MKRNYKHLAVIGLATLILTGSCRQAPKFPVTDETTTRGNIKIAVDDAYHLLADSEVSTYMGLYRYSKITPIYASEDSILRLFLADSVRLMISSRKLTANEEAYLRDKLVIVRTTPIAKDALAFIVNKGNKTTEVQYNTIKDIFLGNITSWKEVDSKNRLGKLKVVFDNPKSSNVRMIMSKFAISGALPDFCYSTNSNAQVIDYVESHPESLGIISVNWISDRDDSITHAFLKRVKVLAVTPDFEPVGDEFFTPHPAYIADKSYPFIRDVYAISRETFSGLGSGFINFMAHDQGQRIVLKMGMVPAQMPIRLVQIEKQ